jgi:hypothetical protein
MLQLLVGKDEGVVRIELAATLFGDAVDGYDTSPDGCAVNNDKPAAAQSHEASGQGVVLDSVVNPVAELLGQGAEA